MAAVPKNSVSHAPHSKTNTSESSGGSSNSTSEPSDVNPFAQAAVAREGISADIKTTVQKHEQKHEQEPEQKLPTPPPKPTPPDKKLAPQWLFNYSRVGLEVRIDPKGWTQLEPAHNVLVSRRHKQTGVILMFLDEGEQTADGDEKLAGFQGYAKDLCDRFFAEYKAKKFFEKNVGGQSARLFLVGMDTSVGVGVLLPCRGLLLKLLLIVPKTALEKGQKIVDSVIAAIHVADSSLPVKPVKPKQFFDVRYGIPSSQWCQAVESTFPSELGVCHEGIFIGVLKQDDLNAKIISRECNERTLVFAPIPENDRCRRWTTIADLREQYPTFAEPTSPFWERLGEYGGISLAIGAGVGFIGGAIYASMKIPMAEALEGGMMVLLGIVVSIFSLVFGAGLLKVGGQMLSRGRSDALMTLFMAFCCFGVPLIMVTFVMEGFVNFIVGASKWLGLVLLVMLGVTVVAALIGLGIGAIVGKVKSDEKATQGEAPPVPPQVSLELLTE